MQRRIPGAGEANADFDEGAGREAGVLGAEYLRVIWLSSTASLKTA